MSQWEAAFTRPRSLLEGNPFISHYQMDFIGERHAFRKSKISFSTLPAPDELVLGVFRSLKVLSIL